MRLPAIGALGAMLCTALAVSLAGCATMNRGRTQVVRIDSSLAGARVQVQPEGQMAVTPALVELARKHQHMVTVEREGYEAVSVNLARKRSAGILLNLIWLHPFGIITDLSTGSGYNLEPDHVSVSLVPVADKGPSAMNR